MSAEEADSANVIATAAAALGLALSDAQCAALAGYAALVVNWNRYSNLTGAQTAGDFAGKFIADALAIAPFVRGPVVADLGSGNGLPGLVLAILEPAWRVVLVESRGRRARFLQQARIDLGLQNVEVVQARIEDWHPQALPRTVVCQAVGSLGMILALTGHLHSPDCRILALKGRSPAAELAELGATASACAVHPLAVPGWQDRHLVVVDCARLPSRD